MSGGGASSTVTSPAMNMSPGDLNVGYGGEPELFVTQAGDGATTAGSSIGALPGGGEIGTGGAQIPIFIARDGGSTAGSTGTIPALSTLADAPDVGYGGGPELFVTRAGDGATTAGSSIGALPGGAEVGTGGGQDAVVAVDGASPTSGPTVAASSASSSPAAIAQVPSGAPMQVVSGTPIRAWAQGVGLG
jgi:hypothetical protein